MTPSVVGTIYRAVLTAFAVYASADHADIRAPNLRQTVQAGIALEERKSNRAGWGSGE
jgi:hypothetical protein